ncbi:hypothetical protein [Alkalibacterium sp. MB6]|uniref:hypothetical protein n=1 Tax=Alkalibacterium sp. MB6 TaxID=2081965 RepID=UPI001379CB33|nr:hypothetical protein [Alkalibacterium sp. MB6]
MTFQAITYIILLVEEIKKTQNYYYGKSSESAFPPRTVAVYTFCGVDRALFFMEKNTRNERIPLME